MKMKSFVLIATLFASTLFAQTGSEIFNKNCSSCHADSLGVTVDLQDRYKGIYKAPYIKDLVIKLKAKTQNQEAFTSFIQSYINDPSKRKSLYGKRAIKEFGLMPSLKGALTDEEIVILSDYLYFNFEKKRKARTTEVAEVIDPREELFNKNCSSCHAEALGVTVDLQDRYKGIYKAPYIKDLVKKLKTKTQNQEAFIAFIQSYINDPSKRKSLYGKRAIKEFGLMPSLKGAMTDEESAQLAEYLYEIYK
nr:c-type cytochrome [uncultured Sulfurimonas sp.]